MKLLKTLLTVSAIPTFVSGVSGMQLDVNSPASIKGAASKVAGGLVGHWFKGEQDAITAGFEVPAMWFWWEAGELWNGLIDYWFYTGDTTYLSITHDYLQAQIGPTQNYILPSHRSDEANDDQAHWGLAAMTAAERNLPQPTSTGATWLQTVINLWNFQVAQWDTVCGGGLRWGIYAGDYKFDYKNAITNGAFFQISARLALFTGDAKYTAWAEKSWAWAVQSGLLTADYKILDGIHVETCKDISTQRWSTNHGVYLYGTAVMYKLNGSPIWKQHTDALVASASSYFFNPPNNIYGATPIIWEPDCELGNFCNNDEKLFKATLARYLYATVAVAPHTSATIFPLLEGSAKGAAAACMGEGGALCGSKWYRPDDGVYDPTSQLGALEIIQGLMLRLGLGVGNTVRYFGDAGSSALKEMPSTKEDTKGVGEAKGSETQTSAAPREMDPVEAGSSPPVPTPEEDDILCDDNDEPTAEPEPSPSPETTMIAIGGEVPSPLEIPSVESTPESTNAPPPTETPATEISNNIEALTSSPSTETISLVPISIEEPSPTSSSSSTPSPSSTTISQSTPSKSQACTSSFPSIPTTSQPTTPTATPTPIPHFHSFPSPSPSPIPEQDPKLSGAKNERTGSQGIKFGIFTTWGILLLVNMIYG